LDFTNRKIMMCPYCGKEVEVEQTLSLKKAYRSAEEKKRSEDAENLRVKSAETIFDRLPYVAKDKLQIICPCENQLLVKLTEYLPLELWKQVSIVLTRQFSAQYNAEEKTWRIDLPLKPKPMY